MDNFEYSIQLSDRDWAEFASAADECASLQAALASGDEPLSSDIDQGDSSGSSPPAPGAGSPFHGVLITPEEGEMDTSLVSSFRCERGLAQGGDQQTPRTSTWPEGQLPRGPAAPAPSPPPPRSSRLEGLGPEAGGAGAAGGPAMQSAPHRTQGSQVPAPPPPPSPCSSGKGPPADGSPGPSPRGPGRKKKKSGGSKAGGSPKSQDPKRRGPLSPAPEDAASREPALFPAGQDATSSLDSTLSALRRPKSSTQLSVSEPPPNLTTAALEAQAGSSLSSPVSTDGLKLGPSTPTFSAGADQSQTTTSSEDGTEWDERDLSTPASKEGPELVLSTPTFTARPEVDLSTPTSTPGPEQNQSASTSSAKPELGLSTPASTDGLEQNLSTPASTDGPEQSPSAPNATTGLELDLSTRISTAGPEPGLSTPVSIPGPELDQSTPTSTARPELDLSTPTSSARPELDLPPPVSTAASELDLSTPTSTVKWTLHPITAGPVGQQNLTLSPRGPPANLGLLPSVPPAVFKQDLDSSPPHLFPEHHSDLAPLAPGGKQDVNQMAGTLSVSETPAPTSISELHLDLSKPTSMNLSTPAPVAEPWGNLPTPASASWPSLALPTPTPGERQDGNWRVSRGESSGELSEGADGAMLTPKPREEIAAAPDRPGDPLSEPPMPLAKSPRRKKVRFSLAEVFPGEGSVPPAPGSPGAVTPRTAGARGGPGAWDAVAVSGRGDRPRARPPKLPAPPWAPSSSSAPRDAYAVTLPEMYDFFFCDTIPEEPEPEPEPEAPPTPPDMQWPEVCEYFFRGPRGRGPRRLRSPPPPPRRSGSPPPRGPPVPISIPEAYEHFLGEGPGRGEVGAGDAMGGPDLRRRLQDPHPRPPLAAAELDIAVAPPGRPLVPFTQNDICLGFMAFATWAVRTSDLHAPDAWKTESLSPPRESDPRNQPGIP
uniref:PPARGC1 and ESRR induced regulator, muscle 1 n=1 Tax=Ornithorhynchus anatinus TaxID=9258 RepID=A0A6I8N362_ORNAN